MYRYSKILIKYSIFSLSSVISTFYNCIQTVLANGDNILKKGYLLKGPDSANEKLFSNFSSKTFKRRFACLR